MSEPEYVLRPIPEALEVRSPRTVKHLMWKLGYAWSGGTVNCETGEHIPQWRLMVAFYAELVYRAGTRP